jgi:hypothetical protein
MRKAYDDRALESRFLTIDMEPGRAADVPINLPDGQKAEALDLRNKLLMYRLRNRLVVSLDTSQVDPGLEPRMNQILLPLLSVIPDEGLRAVIRAKASALQSGLLSERSASSEGQVLTILRRLVAERSEASVSVAAITSAFGAAYGGEYERPISNRWVGSILRRLGVGLYKSNGVFVLAPQQEERIDALYTRYGIEGEKSD